MKACIINKQPLTPLPVMVETEIRLAKFFGMTPDFYDLQIALRTLRICIEGSDSINDREGNS